jgi:hypothetical protein
MEQNYKVGDVVYRLDLGDKPKLDLVTDKSSKARKTVGGTILALVLWSAWVHFGSQLEMSAIENKVATNAVKEYKIAKREGSPIQICSQAGMVTAAYLQAKDEAKYNEWKVIEHSDCSAAGLDLR